MHDPHVARAGLRRIRALSLALSVAYPASLSLPPESRGSDQSDLATLVPADALVHVEWFGGSTARAGAEPLLEWAKFLPTIGTAVKDDPANIEQSRAIGECLDSLWNSRVSLTLVDVSMSDAGPDVQLAILVRPSEGIEPFMARIEKFIRDEHIQPSTREIGGVTFSATTVFDLPMPTFWAAHDGLLIVALSPKAAEAVIQRMNGAGTPLTGNAEFTAVRTAMGGGDLVLSGYINASAALARGRRLAAEMMAAPTLPPIVETIIEESGLNGLISKGFQITRESDRFRFAVYLHAPAPRKGLFDAWDQKPINEDDFAFVPADAYCMQAFNWDVKATYRQLLNTLGRIDPGYPPMVSNVMNVSIGKFGVHPIDDVLAHFGDTWVYYDAPDQGGMWFAGGVLVTEVADPKPIVASLERLGARVSAMPELKQSQVKLAVVDVRCGGRDLQQLVLQRLPIPISLTWGAAEGRLVFGLFPQTVATALDQIDPATRRSSLVAADGFREARRHLPASAVAVGYSDHQAGLRLAYPLQLFLAQIANSFAAGQDIGFRPDAFDPLTHQLRRTHNAVGVTTVDDDGILYAMMDPGLFGPGAVGTSTVATSLGSAAVAISVMLPSLQRARELSKRTVSAANLRQIGQLCHIHAAEHQGEFPPDLGVLLESGMTEVKHFRAPQDSDRRVGEISYSYIAGQTTDADPANVLAYEHPDINNGEGGNVLFISGIVEFKRGDTLSQAVRATYIRLGRLDEIPDFAR